MKKLIFALTLMLFSVVSSAKETWVIKNMPEVKYLFRLTNGSDLKESAAKVASLVEEAKKLNLVFSKTVFFKVDLIKKTSTEAGLEVSGPNLEKVPFELLKVRPTGKFLIGHYAGMETGKLYKSIGPQFKQKKLTAKGSETYVYTKNPRTDKAILILVFPVN